MVQVKKNDVRDAILGSAYELFLAHGYTQTTLSEISRHSGVTVSNVYNYFDSKLGILAAIYEPWFDEHLAALSERVDRENTPRNKIRRLVIGLIQEIPEKDSGFAHLWLEAISSRRPDDDYSRAMLFKFEDQVAQLIGKILPNDDGEKFTRHNLISHLLFMAFDGFAINFHASGKSQRAGAIADLLTDSILMERE